MAYRNLHSLRTVITGRYLHVSNSSISFHLENSNVLVLCNLQEDFDYQEKE